MGPKQKAQEIIERFEYEISDVSGMAAKSCALYLVDEIDKAIDFDWMEVQNLESQHRYWANVRIEIEKL